MCQQRDMSKKMSITDDILLHVASGPRTCLAGFSAWTLLLFWKERRFSHFILRNLKPVTEKKNTNRGWRISNHDPRSDQRFVICAVLFTIYEKLENALFFGAQAPLVADSWLSYCVRAFQGCIDIPILNSRQHWLPLSWSNLAFWNLGWPFFFLSFFSLGDQQKGLLSCSVVIVNIVVDLHYATNPIGSYST